MALLFCIVTGLTIGGLTAYITARDSSALILDLTAGISGAILGGWLLEPVFQTTSAAIHLLDKSDVFSAAGGALLLLAISHLLQIHDRAHQ